MKICGGQHDSRKSSSRLCSAVRSFNLAFDRNRDRQGALNRCCRCQYEWRDQPFGLARYDECPKCNSVYWQWLNHERCD